MKVETEMDAGGAGYFLVDNEISLRNIEEVRVTQGVRYIGAQPYEVFIEYLTSHVGTGTKTWVSEKRAGKTKAELLAKL